MARKSFVLMVVGIVTFFLCSVSSADVPHKINYQGKLTNSDGELIDDVVSIVFSIYEDATKSDPLWQETQSSVTVAKSVFSVVLGSVTTIPDSVFDGSTRYLGIKVEDDSEMSPRKPLVSVGYAYKAGTDGDWTFRITDTADTTLMTGGAWGIARFGSQVYGNADSTHVNLGVSCTTGVSGSFRKYCTVGGGVGNIVTGTQGTVSGGEGNRASWIGATVGGGVHNTASGSWPATVSGGEGNTASGQWAAVGGGSENEASGQHATIPGGYMNTVAGDYSFAAGRYVRLTSAADYTFGFGYNFSTSTPHAVVFYDAGSPIRLGVQVTAPTHYIDVAGGAYCNGTQWVDASSIKYKKDICSLTPQEYQDILNKLAQTEVVRYRYKSEDNGELHIGVIAEDAPEEMVDAERTGIPTGDAIGFLLAALKAQQDQLEVLKGEIERMKSGGQ